MNHNSVLPYLGTEQSKEYNCDWEFGEDSLTPLHQQISFAGQKNKPVLFQSLFFFLVYLEKTQQSKNTPHNMTLKIYHNYGVNNSRAWQPVKVLGRPRRRLKILKLEFLQYVCAIFLCGRREKEMERDSDYIFGLCKLIFGMNLFNIMCFLFFLVILYILCDAL